MARQSTGMVERRLHLVLSLVLAGLVVLAGCGGAGGGGDAGVARTEPVERQAADGASGGGGDAAAGAPTATPALAEDADTDGASKDFARQRSLIRTGRVELEVDDFEGAKTNLTAATESYGGFVSDSQRKLHRVDNETYVTGALELRVPRENFSALLTRVEAEGTVLAADTEVQDVTDQLVDLNARLDNLRAERDQLRTLYRRANDTEDVLAVQRRLSDVQEEIERLEARKQSLERRVALSTIRVELREPRPEPEPEPLEQWYEEPIVGAFLESVDGVVVTLRAMVVLGAYALPYILVFGLPLLVIGFLLRRRGGGALDQLRNR